MKNIPNSVQKVLWSYDLSKIDIKKDKEKIIFNVLNFGDLESVSWLWQQYSREELKKIIKNSIANNWSSKSLNYWSIFFETKPERLNRFV